MISILKQNFSGETCQYVRQDIAAFFEGKPKFWEAAKV